MNQGSGLSQTSTDADRYRLLIESIRDYAIFMLDRDGHVLTWNPGAERFKGYTREEIVGRHFSAFYTEEDRATDLPERALIEARTHGRFEHEGWRVRKDGSRFWANVVIDPIHDESGELIGYAKITRDVSERRWAEEALAQSEQRFRLLVQGVTDYAIYMLDPGGRVSSWNAGAERFKGYTAQEILGESFARFYTDEDRAAGIPSRALATAARDGRFETEGWRVRKDGSRFWASVVVDAIRDSSGALIGFAKITRDLTERKKAEEALQRAQAGLVQAQKMESIGQLTGGIAHDFNNLLTAVLGSLELLRKRLPDDPKMMRLLDNAVRGAQRGATLTQRMLAFARRQDLQVGAIDVVELVQGMAQLFETSVGSTVEIETRLPLSLPAAQGDVNQLELALLNLVVNARDAMPEGGRITIAARSETLTGQVAGSSAPGEYVCLSVTDTGEGMDEATLARAAEPFFTTKGVGRGTGLGLSMVHGIAEQSGGRLVLASRKGEGTTAEIWLPAARQEHRKLAHAERTEDAAARTEPLTILVVDDDPLVLMNTAAMLDDLGHRVLEASSGEQALRILNRSPGIDLMITDQVMPGMTGAQLIAAVRAQRPDLPVILATGYAELPAGTDPLLPKLAKPYQQLTLARAIAEQRARRAAGETVLRFRPRATP